MDDDSQSNDDFQQPEDDNLPVTSPPLPEDNDPPAAPATDGSAGQLPVDHPSTDSVEETEAYHEGIPGAAEVDTASENSTADEDAL